MTAALTFYFTVVVVYRYCYESDLSLVKYRHGIRNTGVMIKLRVALVCLFFVFDGNITVAVGSDRNSSRPDPRKSGRARKLETVQAQTPRREPILAPKGYIPYTLLLYTCEDSDKSQISPAARAISSGT